MKETGKEARAIQTIQKTVFTEQKRTRRHNTRETEK